MKNKLFWAKLLLIINAIFWFGIAVYFSFFKFANKPDYLFLKILLFGEPIVYLISLWGIMKKKKFVYLISIFFVIGNAILSITDQVGSWDMVSLILNTLALISLILIWPLMIKK